MNRYTKAFGQESSFWRLDSQSEEMWIILFHFAIKGDIHGTKCT